MERGEVKKLSNPIMWWGMNQASMIEGERGDQNYHISYSQKQHYITINERSFAKQI